METGFLLSRVNPLPRYPWALLCCYSCICMRMLSSCLFDVPGASRAQRCLQPLSAGRAPRARAVCKGWVKIFIPQLMAPVSLEQPELCYCLRPVLMRCHHFCELFLKFVFHLLKNSHINYLILCGVILIRRNWSTFPIVKIFSTVQY